MIYNLLSRMIKQDNFGVKEEFQSKMDIFFALNRLNEEQYTELTNALSAKA